MRSDAFRMAGDFTEAAASLERAIELQAHAPAREAMAQEIVVLDQLAAAAQAAVPAAAAQAAALATAAAIAAAPAAAAAAAPAASTVPGDSSGAASALPTDRLSEVATKVACGALPAGSLAEAAAACSLRVYALAQGHKAPLREHVWLRVSAAPTLT